MSTADQSTPSVVSNGNDPSGPRESGPGASVTPTPLAVVRGARQPARVDLDVSPVPEWLRDWQTFTDTAGRLRRKATRRMLNFLIQLPGMLWYLSVVYPLPGLWLVICRVSRFVYDRDSADLRNGHAGSKETGEYMMVSRQRKANLHTRWLVLGVLSAPVLVPLLAWTYPRVLAGLAGALVFALVVKAIPGRGWAEVVSAALVAIATFVVLPSLLERIPRPPAWPFIVIGVAVWLTLGWVGRPRGVKLGNRRFDDPSAAGKPTADMVTDALVDSVPGITEKNRDRIRWHAPGVARTRGGYYLAGELPPGVTVSDVIENKEEFCTGLQRNPGAVWPTRGRMHPGHMRLFIGDEEMASAEQARWPLADGKRVDIFNPLPLFTDQEGRWFEQRIIYNAIVIGGAPGYGKSYAIRELASAVALDPRVKVKVYDGKGGGDLRPLRLVADEYNEGDELEDIKTQVASVQAVREEMRRRLRFLRELPPEENPEDKVMSALVDKYPHLAPIVMPFDEIQVYTEHEDKNIREAFISALADIVRRGRSAGIVPVICTQKPAASVIPSIITDNCSVRLCFRVNGQRANDAVLGNEMHSTGIKATKFGPDDKGLAWLKGDGAEPLVVRTVHGFDKPTAEKLMAKARAMRQQLNLLTGYAAGDEAKQEDEQVRLLDDCREVMGEANAQSMHFVTLLDHLALLRPGLYGVMDSDGLGAALRGASVRTGQVKVNNVNRQGVRREWLDIAATSDENPDDDDPAAA